MKTREVLAMHGRDGARPSRCGVRGFTLIEVLASMAVLLILTLALTRMFVSATDITKRGMTSIARNSVGETAMESILQDLDCMVVNERLACYKHAVFPPPTPEDNFDTLYFIGTSGDQDDDMPYEYFKYFVKSVEVTNSLGAVYKRFDLVKSRTIMAVGASLGGFYALDPSDVDWWELFDEIPFDKQDHEVLAENVVGFDIYCQDWQGIIFQKDYSSMNAVKVKYGSWSGTSSNMPPMSFDVRLKLTSPEAAEEGGMLLMERSTEDRGWELLNREASTLFGRAAPMMGASQYRLQRRSAKNPVKHYYSGK